MTDFYSQNRCVCSTRSRGPLLCAFCLSFHFKRCNEVQFSQSTFTCNEVVLVNYFLLFTSLHLIYFSYLFRYI